MPESFWDSTKNEIKGADFRKRYDELTASDAAAAVRRNSVPTPENYKPELPKELKLPDGVNFKFDDADPILGPVLKEARKTANELGLDQAGFSRLLGLHAAARAGELTMLKTAHEAEVAKLGPAGTARINAVETFMEAKWPGSKGVIMPSIVTAAQVEVWENVIKAMTSTGASFTNGHREPELPGKVDQATYDRMSYSEKKDYTSRFQNGARA